MTPLLPLDDAILTSLLNHFSKSALIASGLVGLLFTIRITVIFITLSSAEAYGELIKDTVSYFILVGLFPKLFMLTNEIIGSLAMKLYFEPAQVELGSVDKVLNAVKDYNPIYQVFHSLWVPIVSNGAQAISTLLISILVSIGPIIILLNSMLNISAGAKAYLTTLLSFCLWPILWNTLGSLSNELMPAFSGTSLLKAIFWFVLQILQLLSPILCIFLFNSFAPGRALSTTITKIAPFIPSTKRNN